MLYNDDVSREIISKNGRLLNGSEKPREGEVEVICLHVTCPARQISYLYYGDMSETHIADAVYKFQDGARAVDNATGYFRMAVPSKLLSVAQ